MRPSQQEWPKACTRTAGSQQQELLCTSWAPNSVPPLSFPATLEGGPYREQSDRETEAQRDYEMYPKPPSIKMTQLKATLKGTVDHDTSLL